ncbi:MAG: M14 family zinc carboxypeptidase, partial [Gaiellaceae bacterium]
MERRFVLAGLCGLAIVLAGAAAAVSPAVERSLAAPACDPIQTPPSFRGEVPTAEQVLGFPLGSQEVTSAESNTYVDAVDAASPRVISGTVTTSWLGRPFRFALVGKPGNLSRTELPRIQASLRRLMDPATPAGEADRIARTTPAILWLLGNVHGGEESGTDSELRILFELADRDDCAARQILDDAVVGIMPTQNPDGREAETRENFYRFDMNREWFARTQRETDAKIELLRQFPGILHVDAHEMGGADYFFPPNADPIHHEHTDFNVDVTDNLYGTALAAEFNRQGIPFFTNEVFDFFAPVFGDTTPSHIFGSVGMTFEKEAGDPISQRTYEHYVTQWVALSQGALNREPLLRRWHGEWVQAFQEGLAGRLQPNEVNDPGNTVERPVPTDPVRHYFIRADEPSKAREVQSLVRRLQRTDVAVYRLTAPLAVPDFKEYGRPVGAAVLPAGTYWIPMAQQQKHWIQALLGEDTYVPFRYFFDVSGWNNVMLFNVTGGRSGAVLNPTATLVGLLPQPPDPPLPSVVPSVAVFQPGTTTSANQSTGWLRYLLEQRWHLPYQLLTA